MIEQSNAKDVLDVRVVLALGTEEPRGGGEDHNEDDADKE